jgi:hypothetical protein
LDHAALESFSSLELLAVIVIGAYLYYVERRVRFPRRQERRMKLAKALPALAEESV